MKEVIKVVAIDFDDTLCLTEDACFRVENFVASQLGFPPQSREVHLNTWGQPVEQASIIRFPGINPREFKILLDKIFPEFIERGELDQVSEVNYQVLDRIKALGKSLTIVTSRSQEEVRHLINPKHPLALRIDAFYHGNNTKFLKPDPRVFAAMLDRFKIAPHEAVYVGDSVNDVVSANKAGLVSVVSLESGLRKKEDFKDVQVDYFIQRFPDILNIIQ